MHPRHYNHGSFISTCRQQHKKRTFHDVSAKTSNRNWQDLHKYLKRVTPTSAVYPRFVKTQIGGFMMHPGQVIHTNKFCIHDMSTTRKSVYPRHELQRQTQDLHKYLKRVTPTPAVYPRFVITKIRLLMHPRHYNHASFVSTCQQHKNRTFHDVSTKTSNRNWHVNNTKIGVSQTCTLRESVLLPPCTRAYDNNLFIYLFIYLSYKAHTSQRPSSKCFFRYYSTLVYLQSI